ncbi:hypothetical protein ED733_002326 [Metarhizium rileyi]|uniref:Alpha/gamma-adaptin-binding protein p34 n=1 Tax=Metarhizium rileyi (strain RCEF 4871) TaxID=1649241 RepID=A0A5C6G424_METRR|nr:hypothetical protein ED733_002326 [Metarhizium rileyi]
MDVAHPRRILAVSLDTQAEQLSRVIRDLTGSEVGLPRELAGTTCELVLRTRYYTAAVPVWLDLVVSPSEWSASFLSDEAGEVLAVLGGLVVVFALPATEEGAGGVRDLLRHVGRVVDEGLGAWEWDGVRLAVGVGDARDAGDAEEWDELCAEAGLEFVQVGGGHVGLNDFGGIPRVREALESNDWAQAPSDFGHFEGVPDDGDDEHLGAENLEFGFDPADFEALKKAIWEARPEEEPPATAGPAATSSGDAACDGSVQDGLDDEDVDRVEKMMRKLQAARDAGEGLPEAQRKRMAARAVEEVMKEL